TLPARVLEAIITLYTLERNIWLIPAGGRLVVNRVAAVANIIMDYQNEMGLGDEKDDDEDGHRKQQALKIRTVGSIARKDLHLQTQKSSIGTRARQVVWDEARIEGLRRRYGLADDDWLNELADVVRKRYDWRQIYGLEGDDNGNGVPERQASFV
ncbi:MAG: hypothetical protein ACE5EY_11030, partial [Anaerolineae bacterium]